jgi:2-aminomuconate deaminase
MVGINFVSELTPRANYPLAKRVGDLVFVSGLSARRPDNTFAGATADAMGTVTLDIEAQTEAVIANLRDALQRAGGDLDNLVAVTCYLQTMNDFGGFNRVYNRFFDKMTGPTRTTVAVHQLPHPHILVEISGIAHLGAALVSD